MESYGKWEAKESRVKQRETEGSRGKEKEAEVKTAGARAKQGLLSHKNPN